MVITCDFPCTYILVLVKNRLYVLFVPNGAQWYMDPWSFGFVAKWIHGSLDSWHNGCIAVWIHATMDVWQFGCMVFSKTSPMPSAAVQNQNTLCTLTLIYSKSPKTKNSKTFWRLVIFCRCFNLVDK